MLSPTLNATVQAVALAAASPARDGTHHSPGRHCRCCFRRPAHRDASSADDGAAPPPHRQTLRPYPRADAVSDAEPDRRTDSPTPTFHPTVSPTLDGGAYAVADVESVARSDTEYTVAAGEHDVCADSPSHTASDTVSHL